MNLRRTTAVFGRKLNQRPKSPRRRLAIQILDQRLLMHGDCGLDDHAEAGIEEALEPYTQTAVLRESMVDWSLLLSVPQLESKPGAAATLVLDFNGHTQATWENSRGEFTDLVTPSFNADGTGSTFSLREQEIIRNAWAAVAEDFAPFDINVTTIEPADPDHAMVTRVAIGGHPSDWYRTDSSPSGTSSIGSFTSDVPNLAFAFSEILVDDAADDGLTDEELAITIGNTVSHEAGHGFGLRHQSEYNAAGDLVDSYHEGDADWTPIMGSNFQTDRVTWHNGTTSDAETFQKDLDVISSYDNGFGYRADDHGNSMSTATPVFGGILGFPEAMLNVSGIVETMSDADYFRFETTGGTVNATLNVAEFAPNLDARLELWRPAQYSTSRFGQVLIAKASRLAMNDDLNELGASISVALTAGTYYLVVRSHGQYGDLGQYTLTGDLNLAARKLEIPPYPLSAQSLLTSTQSTSLKSGDSPDGMMAGEELAMPLSELKKSLPGLSPLASPPSETLRSTDLWMSHWGHESRKLPAMLELDNAVDHLAAMQVKLTKIA